jgi:hypothetical protein
MAVKEQFFRYRIITNLLCNMQPNCYFCYQPNKDPKMVLDMEKMKDTFRRCGRKMKRATIMGGESTILPNLHEYIALTKANVEEDVCLVTNGILLDEKRIIKYAEAGLTEVAISISSLPMYYARREQALMCRKYIPNTRINIPKCNESNGDALVELLKHILTDGFYAVVCEDLMGRYGEFDFEEKLPAKKIKDDGCNFFDYTWNGHQFGVFGNYNGYNATDIIVTPVGTFSRWEDYCKKIGNVELCGKG